MDNETREMFSLILSRFDSIDTRLDKMDKRLDKMDERLDRMDERLDKMDERLDSMDNRLNILEYKQNVTARKLDDLQLDVQNLRRYIRRDIHHLNDTTETIVEILKQHEMIPL